MSLPTLNDANVDGKKVLLRADLDVDPEAAEDSIRLQVLIPTLKLLAEKRAKIIIIGHRGRPEGKPEPSLSLNVISQKLSQISNLNVGFVDDIYGDKAIQAVNSLAQGNFLMLENLRFSPGEEANDPDFVNKLSSLGDFFVNEAFSVSHREHASIVGLPTKLPHAAGLRLEDEIKNLTQVVESPIRPAIVVISGVKTDKLVYAKEFTRFADKILIAGKLPDMISLDESKNEKFLVAGLNPDKEDITLHSIEMFEAEISSAGTIVLAGPIGKFEEEGQMLGTERVFKAVANSHAFRVAGGGDTQKAISLLKLEDKFDWISVGGGAMLDFLARGTLPGIEALEK